MSEKLDSIIDSISELSVLELSELVKALEDKFGVTAAAPMAMMGAMPMAGAAAEAEDEGPSSYDVILKEVGSSKIQVIKLVKEIAGLGLKEAKALVDSAPAPVKEGLSNEDANKLKEELEGAGATIELKTSGT